MPRTIALLVVFVAGACTDLDSVRSHEPDGVSSAGATSVPTCLACLDRAPCSALDEVQCQSRSDCEAVYDPTSTTPRFVECRDKAQACVKEGELCTPSSTGATDPKCCDGLFCCPGGIVNDGQEHCYAACPV